MRLVPMTFLLAVAMLGSGPASETVNSYASQEEFASTNVALASAGGVATASANTATQALVNDGDTAAQGWAVLTSGPLSRWTGARASGQSSHRHLREREQQDLQVPVLERIGLGRPLPTYTSNTAITVSYSLPSPVSTVAVRLNFTSAAASVYVNELQAFSKSLTYQHNVALASAGGVATASANTATQALVNDGNTAAQGWVVPTTGPRSRWTGARASR